jgi:hypothetical protein
LEVEHEEWEVDHVWRALVQEWTGLGWKLPVQYGLQKLALMEETRELQIEWSMAPLGKCDVKVVQPKVDW